MKNFVEPFEIFSQKEISLDFIFIFLYFLGERLLKIWKMCLMLNNVFLYLCTQTT